MNKIFLTSIISLAALSSSAQNAYEAANIIESDLNGSARYVGMGGALNALGADISLMGKNPAGIGLYRRSDLNFTFGGLITGEQPTMPGASRSRMSVDQGGVVFAFRTDNGDTGVQFVNIGVNYTKNRNFFGNNSVYVQNLNGMYSQTHEIANIANECAYYDKWGLLSDVSVPFIDDKKEIHDGIVGLDDDLTYYGITAQDARYRRNSNGGTTRADINIAINSSDRFYIGAAVGIYDMNFRRESFYEELGTNGRYYDFSNWYISRGTGVDVKMGVICRPIPDSPFRFGVTINTPVWYNITEANGTSLYLGYTGTNIEYCQGYGDSGDYDYKFRTPWKFNFSLGHTVGTNFAIGAEYEFTDYSSARYTSLNFDDKQYMDIKNDGIKSSLKGQHTLKLGMEYKPTQSFSIRAGYNFLSSSFKKDAYKQIIYTEPTTETDYTNWGATHRITAGLGWRFKNAYIDLAYQCQMQKGDFYAFDNYQESGNEVYTLKPTNIKNNRHQIIGTIGFNF